MVEVKDCSCVRIDVIRSLRRVSAAVVWTWRKKRARRTWVARRSVGVGEEDEVSGLGSSGFEVRYLDFLGRGGRSSYIGLRPI